MTKTYFNSAIIGNSRMLGCLTDRGELVRLFWPNIDYQQHIDRFFTGVYKRGHENRTVWLHEDSWICSQNYIDGTNIIQTLFTDHGKGLQIRQTDFVLPEKDVLTRFYEFENLAEEPVELDFMLFAALTTNILDLRSTLFDFRNDALIFYRHNQYISITADKDVFQFQLGNNALEAATGNLLRGHDNIGMMPDGSVSWQIGILEKGNKKGLNLFISASTSLRENKDLTGKVRKYNKAEILENTGNYWHNYLSGLKKVETGRNDIDALYKRSLLVFSLMSDNHSGGLLAAPEIDEEFTRCGRYAYCWGRDAAFITEALDKCGLLDTVGKFYKWAARTQDDDGSWQQRYHMDGNLAPSWGLQIDETGSLIWGMLKHYEALGDKGFLLKMWKCVEKGVEFLIGFRDNETGLPLPSYDIWEERVGEHAYSSAAVYGGICAGIEIGRILGFEGEHTYKWKKAAFELKTAIEKNFWQEDRSCFLRSVRTKLNPWGEDYSSEKVVLTVNPKGFKRDFTLKDGTMDVSLLGLCLPYGVFSIDDYRIDNTVKVLEDILTCREAGGIKRYENDSYMGGNPWILATLWLASYYIEKKDYSRASEYFEWAVKCRTDLGLLPEQADRNTGKPAWVIPLTWSHAMFVRVLFELLEAGAL